MSTITTVTLTYNEKNNIEECLNSLRSVATYSYVLDGFSSDGTPDIARHCGATVLQKDCNYYDRFEFGMENIHFETDWILFIDADERLTDESARELKALCDKYASSPEVNGIVVNYRVNFMGKELKHGASSLKKLRVFKPGKAFMENIELDQHIRLKEGRMVYMKTFLLHKDYKGIEAWSQKHVRYAHRAAEDYIKKQSGQEEAALEGLEKMASIKRILKYKVYYKLPSGFRAWCFYFYRYYLRLGFLDGREGKIFTFLHAYWYRFLVDAIVYEENKK